MILSLWKCSHSLHQLSAVSAHNKSPNCPLDLAAQPRAKCENNYKNQHQPSLAWSYSPALCEAPCYWLLLTATGVIPLVVRPTSSNISCYWWSGLEERRVSGEMWVMVAVNVMECVKYLTGPGQTGVRVR